MEKKFIIIVWHQAGGKLNNRIYYTLNDEESETALVWFSEQEAKDFWKTHNCGEIHAGFVVEATTNVVDWI
jgi:hypothetical protein